MLNSLEGFHFKFSRDKSAKLRFTAFGLKAGGADYDTYFTAPYRICYHSLWEKPSIINTL